MPIFAALLSAAAVSTAPAAAAAAGDCTPAAIWPAAGADLAVQVVSLVNAHRTQLGLQALVDSPPLDAAATWKARHMAAYGYIDHDDPGPPAARTAEERLSACGYPQAEWAENIATGYATAQAVVDGWLSSPEHRANIEAPEFRATGVGAAAAVGGPVYWSQTFGVVADAGSLAAASVAVPAAAGGSGGPQASATSARAAGAIRVSCAPRGRHVACLVRGARGAMVRIALMRGGHTFARASTRAAQSSVQVRLRPVRRLRAGRYALVVRAGSAHAARTTLIVR